MNVSEQEFKFMTEGITSDLVQMLVDRNNYSLSKAVEVVYNSKTYAALMRPTTNMYSQSSGYVYSYLIDELKQNA